MGLNVSCFDSQNLAAYNETVPDRGLTDDEMTVFLAISNFSKIEVEEGEKGTFKEIIRRIDDENRIISEKTREKSNQKLYSNEKSEISANQKKLQTRIFSSNAKNDCFNIIERIECIETTKRIGKNRSGCSTNVNSGAPSRCVSPMNKPNNKV